MKSSTSRKVGQWILLAVLLASLAWVVAWSRSSGGEGGTRQVTFRVESSGGYAIITMEAGVEKIRSNTTVTTPWERTVSVPRGTQVYLTASNPTQTGQLTCRLTLERKSWKNDKTSAPKDGVACAGIVP